MERFLNFAILRSPVNIMIVLLISTLGMMALAAIFPIDATSSNAIPSPSKTSTGN